MNEIIICGRISNEPDFKSGNTDGKSWYLAKFDVCVPKRHGSRGVKNEEKVDFFHVQASGGYATAINDHCVKGTKLLIRGEMHQFTYVNKKGFHVKSWAVFPQEIAFVESEEIQQKYLRSKEGQRFLSEFCDQTDMANDLAPMVADWEVDGSELPFG